jgi:hypothetical protein
MEGANIMLAVFLLRSFPLIALEGFQSLPFAADWDFTQIQSGVNIGLKVILILSILGTGVETLRRLYREARSPARQES